MTSPHTSSANFEAEDTFFPRADNDVAAVVLSRTQQHRSHRAAHHVCCAEELQLHSASMTATSLVLSGKRAAVISMFLASVVFVATATRAATATATTSPTAAGDRAGKETAGVIYTAARNSPTADGRPLTANEVTSAAKPEITARGRDGAADAQNVSKPEGRWFWGWGWGWGWGYGKTVFHVVQRSSPRPSIISCVLSFCLVVG